MADGPEHQVLSKDETQMEARVAVLEQIAASTNEILSEIKADIREIRRDQKNDFRITFGALITLAVGMAGLMAHGFKWFGSVCESYAHSLESFSINSLGED